MAHQGNTQEKMSCVSSVVMTYLKRNTQMVQIDSFLHRIAMDYKMVAFEIAGLG